MGQKDRDPPETDDPPLVIQSLEHSAGSEHALPLPVRERHWAARIIILVHLASLYETLLFRGSKCTLHIDLFVQGEKY